MLSSPQIFLGIDPGLDGAIVSYDAKENLVNEADIIPTLVLERNGKSKRTLDIPMLVAILHRSSQQHPNLVAYLELVGANPMHGRRQGTSSMYSFGHTNGCIETALVAAGIPYSKVPPSVWKRALNCTQDKDATLARGSELIPSSIPFWTPKRGTITKEKCIGVAEAALIALWGARFGKLRPSGTALLQAA